MSRRLKLNSIVNRLDPFFFSIVHDDALLTE